MQINDETQVGVYEMGVAGPGELLYTCGYFKPAIGVITNIGIDHLQAFSGIDGYIKAKAEMLKGLPEGGTIIVNADDQNIKKIDFSRFKGNIYYYGFNDKSHFKYQM
jgi:UDP-N-acetylmuramoyl-tripeptide--D-alanyl-D-alanine ligase